VHALHRLAHDFDRARAASHNAGAQRRKIEFSKIGVVHFGYKHRRHTVDGGAAFRRDRLQRGERIKAFAREHHGRAVG
jgi:hypothetical protein